MVAFSFLMNRTNKLLGDIDSSAIRTLDILKQRYYAAESSALFGADEDVAAPTTGHTKVAQMRKSV
jgi:hypothetical protein